MSYPSSSSSYSSSRSSSSYGSRQDSYPDRYTPRDSSSNGYGSSYKDSSYSSHGRDSYSGHRDNGYGSSSSRDHSYSSSSNRDHGYSSSSSRDQGHSSSSSYKDTNTSSASHSKDNGNYSPTAPTTSQTTETSDKIDFEKYEDIPVETSGRDCPPSITTWKDLDLGSQIQRNIEAAKYTKPTPVQKYSLPIVLKGRDLMSCAQTGSGKTAAFLLPIIVQLLRSPRPYSRNSKIAPAAIVLAPTRELACQIFDESRKFSAGSSIITGIAYGGVPIKRQLYDLERGCDILVGTPGRIVDIIERGRLTFSEIQYLVLDEADRMLDMGFEPQIRKIVEQHDMPRTGRRQTLMFSATFAKEIQLLAASFLHDYIFLTIGRVGSTTDLVTQKFIKVKDDFDKEARLVELAATLKGLTLIFVETKKKATKLDYFLRKRGFPATSIHGDREQHERTAALKSFSSGQTPFLIATNVAARGLDISNVAHVINFDMPHTIDDYVHRIGRTGRAGKAGVSTSFISDEDAGVIKDLIQVLSDANQEVPDWLSEMRRYGKPGKAAKFNNRSGGPRFGGRDFRNFNQGSYNAPPPQYNYPSAYSNVPPAPYPPTYNSWAPMPPSSSSSYSRPYPPPPSSSYSAPSSSGYGQQAPADYYGYQSSGWSQGTSSYPPADDKKRRSDYDSQNSDRDKSRKTDSGKVYDRY